MKNIYSMILASLFIFNNCTGIGHQGFIDMENDMLGGKLMNYKPYKYKDAGEIIRGNFLLSGDGFTHITKDKKGNRTFHYFLSEVFTNFKGNEKWIGKCLIYKIIDTKTGLVKSWGFDKGGNPLSCRIWN